MILSTNRRDISNRFPEFRSVLLSLACSSASIDGEVVACREDGTPGTRALYSGNESKKILPASCSPPPAKQRTVGARATGLFCYQLARHAHGVARSRHENQGFGDYVYRATQDAYNWSARCEVLLGMIEMR